MPKPVTVDATVSIEKHEGDGWWYFSVDIGGAPGQPTRSAQPTLSRAMAKIEQIIEAAANGSRS